MSSREAHGVYLFYHKCSSDTRPSGVFVTFSCLPELVRDRGDGGVTMTASERGGEVIPPRAISSPPSVLRHTAPIYVRVRPRPPAAAESSPDGLSPRRRPFGETSSASSSDRTTDRGASTIKMHFVTLPPSYPVAIWQSITVNKQEGNARCVEMPQKLPFGRLCCCAGSKGPLRSNQTRNSNLLTSLATPQVTRLITARPKRFCRPQ